MRLLSPIVARPRFPVTAALCGAALAAAAACSSRLAEEPGLPGVIDRPIALLSASKNDLTTIELYLVSEDGNTTVKVPTFTGPKFEVRWSGDGRRIAIAGNTSGAMSSEVGTASDVWIVNPDGSGLQQITKDGQSGSLHWLADGRLIFARAAAGQPLQWFAVPASGGAPIPITLRNGQPVYTPDWSRAGSQMTFSENVTIYTAAVDGTSERALVSGFLPRWSPAGDRIAYVGSSGGVPRLLVVPASGQSRPTPLADLSSLTGPPSGFAWSPDGSRIVWVRPASGSIRAVVGPANGASTSVPLVQRAESTVAVDIDVDWRPTPFTR